ncbi:MAG: membrane protein insertion efficiency factor YidD [candidate division Zixibacteria bacterium]
MNKFMGKILSFSVKVYQLTLGTVLGGRCRYYPSCSEYSRQSLTKHGAFKGLGKTVWRILRCNPWNPGGYDPA